jgi:predicted metal-binding protein/2-polyprenyl-3-methyl-5-hydroxy-6-metoxy-1,4-benzoquinol methylase
MKLNYLQYDPQEAGPQYLEDLATGYWYAEVLFTAVEKDLFTLLSARSMNADEIARELKWDPLAAERFLKALCSLGLLSFYGDSYSNTGLSEEYLVRGQPLYQGDSILWRKALTSGWLELEECLQAGGRVSYLKDDSNLEFKRRVQRYIKAMDNVARSKVQEIVPLFADLFEEGEILDAGAGSGAMAAGFLEQFPGLKATLVDLNHVLTVTREMIEERGLTSRVKFQEANILEQWDLPEEHFDLIILSNIVHAYSEVEIPGILNKAAEVLKPGGYLLVHDFFSEHRSDKAALFDLNMFINTYNGRTFPAAWVIERLQGNGLQTTGLIPLESDTGVIIASRERAALDRLALDPVGRLLPKIKSLGFRQVVPISAEDVEVADWVPQCCRYGCERYGEPHCPPHSPTPDQTRAVLKDFSLALLLEGEPPTRDFQRLALKAEKAAFQAGYHKAFVYWAGPCSLCRECAPDGECRNTRDSRPSMESAGIDVFATARQAGLTLRPLSAPDDYVKYYALLLLE